MNVELYRDGGTLEFEVDGVAYFVDGRIDSGTVGSVFRGYPADGERVTDPEELERLVAVLARKAMWMDWSARAFVHAPDSERALGDLVKALAS